MQTSRQKKPCFKCKYLQASSEELFLLRRFLVGREKKKSRHSPVVKPGTFIPPLVSKSFSLKPVPRCSPRSFVEPFSKKKCFLILIILNLRWTEVSAEHTLGRTRNFFIKELNKKIKQELEDEIQERLRMKDTGRMTCLLKRMTSCFVLI